MRQRVRVRALFHDCQVTTGVRNLARKMRAAGSDALLPLLSLVAGSAGIARRTPVPAPLPLVTVGRTQLKEALLQNTLSPLIPFVADGLAEWVHASGVLAVVVVGLHLGYRARQVDFATRPQ